MGVKTKAAALYEFFNSFGIPAYERCRVRAKATPPYITYDYVTSSFGEGEVSLTVDLWFYTPDIPAFLPNTKYEFDVLDGIWIMKEVLS